MFLEPDLACILGFIWPVFEPDLACILSCFGMCFEPDLETFGLSWWFRLSPFGRLLSLQ